MDLIDSHCHLDFAKLTDLPSEIRLANRAGVSRFVVPSVDKNNWREVLLLTQRYSSVYAALGIHPYFIAAENELEQLSLLAHRHRDNLVALGEMGLDGSIDLSEQRQLEILIPQLTLANDLALPVICHAHKAYDPLLKQLRRYAGSSGGVVHGFSGSLVQAKEFIKLGFKIGVGGVITYQRAKKTRAVFAQIGLEHLVLETDAPDMPISGHQGQVNTPKQLIIIAQTLAELLGQPLEVVAKTTTENAVQLFKL